MFNLDKFIADSVTFHPVSMFVPDIEANKATFTKEIKGKKLSAQYKDKSDFHQIVEDAEE